MSIVYIPSDMLHQHPTCNKFLISKAIDKALQCGLVMMATNMHGKRRLIKGRISIDTIHTIDGLDYQYEFEPV